DNWIEVEAKIKGTLETEKRKMSWSFRIGEKSHSSMNIADTYYFGIKRDRIDFISTPLSKFLSAGIDYRTDFRRTDFKAVKHFVMVEKNFPFVRNQRNYTFSLGVGYQWLAKD